MAAANSQLDQSFEQMYELQSFLFSFVGRLEADKLKPGQDLTPLVKEFGFELPSLLRGESLIWEGHTTPHFAAHGGDTPVLHYRADLQIQYSRNGEDYRRLAQKPIHVSSRRDHCRRKRAAADEGRRRVEELEAIFAAVCLTRMPAAI